MEKYYSIGEFAKLIGKSKNTVREWDEKGKLKPHHITAGKHRVYSEDQVLQVLREEQDKYRISPKRKTVIYCREDEDSSIEDLEFQLNLLKNYMTAKGYSFEVYKEVKNGILFKNTELEKLMNAVMKNEIEKIVILKKDVLSFFNKELIESICSLFNTTIEIVDNTPIKSEHKIMKEALNFIEISKKRACNISNYNR